MRESLIDLANRILDNLEQFLNPEILVVHKQALESLKLDNGGMFGEDAAANAISCIKSNGQFVRREKAENDSTLVQIIPCGVLEHENEVFVFRRKETDIKSRLYGRATIWRGCHVAKTSQGQLPAQLQEALLKRITHSLFLSRVFQMENVGYCWDRGDAESAQHFGVVYRIDIDNPHTALDLHKKEFRQQRGHGLTGQFLKWSDVSSDQVRGSLEKWSQAILDGIGQVE